MDTVRNPYPVPGTLARPAPRARMTRRPRHRTLAPPERALARADAVAPSAWEDRPCMDDAFAEIPSLIRMVSSAAFSAVDPAVPPAAPRSNRSCTATDVPARCWGWRSSVMWAHARFDTRRIAALAAPALVVAGLAEARPLSPSGSAATDPAAGGVSGMLVFLGVMVALFADRRGRRQGAGPSPEAQRGGRPASGADRRCDAARPRAGEARHHGHGDGAVPAARPGHRRGARPAPTPALRDAALGLVLREASASGLPFRVEDRTTVSPPTVSQRAA